MTLYGTACKPTGRWKAVGIALAIVITAAVTEWFVTYCAFSNDCPAAEKVALWPLSKMAAIVDAR
jgi:hypothetical protein